MRNKVKSSCTTILVGKKASIDGSTMIARNEDSEKAIEPKRFIVVQPESQPKIYESKISHVSIPLPENPLRYTATPNADDSIGIWGEAGINQANVAMTATETITSNSRILGVDPYVENGIGEDANKYKATYYQAYVSEFTPNATAEDNVELSLAFAVNGVGQEGYATLSEDQAKVIQYTFKDTVPETV